MWVTRAVLAVVLVLSAACSSGGDKSSDVRADATSTSASVPVTGLDADTSTPPTTVAASPAGGTATTARSGAAAPRPAPSTTTARRATTSAPTTTAGTAPPAGPTAAITIQNFTFSPPVLNVAAGTTVTATNRDGAPHTWTADDGSWDSGTLNQNGSYSRRFPTAGTFPYHCVIHPSMKATVNVS